MKGPSQAMETIKETHERHEQQRRISDAARFRTLDAKICMMCHAYGPGKRSLTIKCGQNISEVVPEAIMLRGVEGYERLGWYIRICKTCRDRLLQYLHTWRREALELRKTPKDHDGRPIYSDPENCITTHIHGTAIVMTKEQHEEYREK